MTDQVVHTHYKDIEAFITKDGSVIRELMHPNVHGNANMSFAEAAVTPGKTTRLHKYVYSHRAKKANSALCSGRVVSDYCFY